MQVQNFFRIRSASFSNWPGAANRRTLACRVKLVRRAVPVFRLHEKSIAFREFTGDPRLKSGMNRKGGNIMLCRDIMKTDVECVSARTPIKEVARKMRDRNVGFAPVCDENWRVLGTITDRDIAIRMVAEELSPNTPVHALMTHEVIAC